MKEPVLIVHGGATIFKSKYHEDILKAVERAALIGYCVIDRGGSAVDAVEAAIWELEETELFTAGRGACENLDGEIEVDAILMDGQRLESGAVMAVRDIIHPISLARYVLDRTPVMQVVGSGANRLYNEMISSGFRNETEMGRTERISNAEGCDTVGSVALDENGRLASGASTSGWPGKLPGRVGDSPIIGAGVYANEVASASCTGKGEQILRIVMGREAVLHVENGLPVRDACQRAMRSLREKTSGEAGVIMLDRDGNIGFAFDTPHMPIAIARNGKVIYSSMKPEFQPTLLLK
ncbi:MAG: isoaspartyl peptidase/L-asparaginase family protein [Candidatus Thorarchaeota archaeon]